MQWQELKDAIRSFAIGPVGMSEVGSVLPDGTRLGHCDITGTRNARRCFSTLLIVQSTLKLTGNTAGLVEEGLSTRTVKVALLRQPGGHRIDGPVYSMTTSRASGVMIRSVVPQPHMTQSR